MHVAVFIDRPGAAVDDEAGKGDGFAGLSLEFPEALTGVSDVDFDEAMNGVLPGRQSHAINDKLPERVKGLGGVWLVFHEMTLTQHVCVFLRCTARDRQR